MEKQVKTYIKALKKSINQERFLIRVAGLEYEVAQKLPQAAPVQENCGPGWERDSGRCGKTGERDLECQMSYFTMMSKYSGFENYNNNRRLIILSSLMLSYSAIQSSLN